MATVRVSKVHVFMCGRGVGLLKGTHTCAPSTGKKNENRGEESKRKREEGKKKTEKPVKRKRKSVERQTGTCKQAKHVKADRQPEVGRQAG